MRTIAILCTIIILEFNKFIDEINKKSDGIQVGMYILSKALLPWLLGVFADEGLDRLLEAAYIRKVDIISPSLVYY